MKKKLRLDLAELRVESFAVDEDAKARGTIRGEERSIYCNTDEFVGCSDYTCAPPSCPAESCGDCGSYQCGTLNCASQYIVDGGCVG